MAYSEEKTMPMAGRKNPTILPQLGGEQATFRSLWLGIKNLTLYPCGHKVILLLHYVFFLINQVVWSPSDGICIVRHPLLILFLQKNLQKIKLNYRINILKYIKKSIDFQNG
jgi:hypothetical protein